MITVDCPKLQLSVLKASQLFFFTGGQDKKSLGGFLSWLKFCWGNQISKVLFLIMYLYMSREQILSLLKAKIFTDVSSKSSHQDEFTWCHCENFCQGKKGKGVSSPLQRGVLILARRGRLNLDWILFTRTFYRMLRSFGNKHITVWRKSWRGWVLFFGCH